MRKASVYPRLVLHIFANTNMKIGVDLRAIGQGKYSGVEEYALNLLGAMLSIDNKNQYIFFVSGGKIGQRYLDFAAAMRAKNPNIQLVHYHMPNRLLNVLFKFIGEPKIDQLMGGVDVVFAPNINLLPVSNGVKTVATIHDLSFAKYREFFSVRQNFWHSFVNPKALAKKADCLIAVSESTKQDLIEAYGISPEKIKVIYSGIAQESGSRNPESGMTQQIKKKYGLPDKYILYLGTIEPRKNIIGLIKAYEIFRSSYNLPASPKLQRGEQPTAYKLVIAGSKGWLYEDIFHAARISGIKDDIIFTDFVADEDKIYLYRMSSLFVYPSFYEGFGFPPLEAMAQGVPVITSDCSSLPEVVGNAGLMVNPYNIGRLAWAMNEVLCNEELREKMVKKGYEQVKKFSWEKCARETLEVLGEAVKKE